MEIGIYIVWETSWAWYYITWGGVKCEESDEEITPRHLN